MSFSVSTHLSLIQCLVTRLETSGVRDVVARYLDSMFSKLHPMTQGFDGGARCVQCRSIYSFRKGCPFVQA